MTRLASAAAASTGLAVIALLATSGVAAAATTTVDSRASLAVHTTSTHTVVAPSTARPGVAEFRNTGSQAVFLVTPRHGAGPATFARDLNADGPAALIANFTVADALPAKANTYLRLHAGTYYLADTSRDGFTTASIRTLHVTGAVANATPPAARAVTVNSHNQLTASATLPKTSELQYTNSSAHLQMIYLVPVGKKVTSTSLKTFVAKPSITKLASVAAAAPEMISALSPTDRATSSQHSAGGRFLVFSLTFTSRTTEPQLAAGQVRLVTVK